MMYGYKLHFIYIILLYYNSGVKNTNFVTFSTSTCCGGAI